MKTVITIIALATLAAIAATAASAALLPFRNARAYANWLETTAAKKGTSYTCVAPTRYHVFCTGRIVKTQDPVSADYWKVGPHRVKYCVRLRGFHPCYTERSTSPYV